ncbi:hypothetical protein FXN65_10930 [Metapseudomonas lalkuanensis]|uniref:Lipoprotein n=1 Tax=Metapseudomonas lalkuanensis TaxID=2604832 RepID=A0A5J6QJH7_9GAMM|nr:hypothetical protein [Pseudomonas lalkuanensis]QEY62563.1 hypothetical protein FXN65_10930 [Pseudomonas lalkuanensis]UCO96213.1 hypothetical protein LF844_16125 [Pseudomonas lalkuanensis]
MKRALIFVALALQACTFAAVAGEWPQGGGEKFTQECVASAARQVPQDKAVAYCNCSNGMMQEAFTSQQLVSVTEGRKPTEDELTVLTDISRSCARETLQ